MRKQATASHRRENDRMIGFITSWKSETRDLCESAFRDFDAMITFFGFCEQAGFDGTVVMDIVAEASLVAEFEGKSFPINIGS